MENQLTELGKVLAGQLRPLHEARQAKGEPGITPEEIRTIIDSALSVAEVIAGFTETTKDDAVVAFLKQLAGSSLLDRLIEIVLNLLNER